MRELDVPAGRFASFLAGEGLPPQRTIAFAGLSTLAVVDTTDLVEATADLGVAKGLSGYYHVIESLPPDVRPGVYGYYWYKRFGPEKHQAWRDAFAFEYNTLRKLGDHDNLAEVWTGELDAEIPYYVMRYYEQGNLAARGAAGGWRLEPSFVLSVAGDVAAGLSHLHRHGVAHRDLNAENVLLTDTGRAVVADLGCARDLSAAAAGPSQRPDEFHWPPEYSDAYDTAGVAADVYSFGVLLYLMITGRMPRHQGPTCAAAAPFGVYPGQVLAVVDTCLAYLPQNRPSSMDLVLAELTR